MYTYKYPRPALTVDAIVYVKNADQVAIKNVSTVTSVLLIQRGNEPFKNKWALPGGFVEMDELLEKACMRELKEETGIEVEQMHQFRTYDAIDRDPRHRTISVVYTAQLEDKKPVVGGDDAAKAAWFLLSELPDLAFDHAQILNDFIGWLKK